MTLQSFELVGSFLVLVPAPYNPDDRVGEGRGNPIEYDLASFCQDSGVDKSPGCRQMTSFCGLRFGRGIITNKGDGAATANSKDAGGDVDGGVCAAPGGANAGHA